jgi:uncharacterized protein (TIGR03086 family)
MEPTEQLAEILPAVCGVVDRVHLPHLDEPTPCERFTVHDVIDHMIVLGGTFAHLFRGEEPPEAAPPAVYGWVPASEFRETMDELFAAVRSPGAMERTIESPMGPMPGSTFARFVAFDGLVHGWDLATATGRTYELPAELVAEVEAFAHEALVDEMRDGDTFKTATTPPPDATPIQRLAAFSGRTV